MVLVCGAAAQCDTSARCKVRRVWRRRQCCQLACLGMDGWSWLHSDPRETGPTHRASECERGEAGGVASPQRGVAAGRLAAGWPGLPPPRSAARHKSAHLSWRGLLECAGLSGNSGGCVQGDGRRPRPGSDVTMRPDNLLCLLGLSCLLGSLLPAESIRWLALRGASWQWNSSASASCRRARQTLGLARRQARLCRLTVEVMPHVARAAAQTVNSCEALFADRRWNCSSVERAPHFQPDLTHGCAVCCVLQTRVCSVLCAAGTREQALVYALSSAAVAHTLARACAAGSLFHCSCAPPPRDPPNGNFKWGGCGDNVRWAAHFGKQFTDSAERATSRASRASSASKARKPGGGGGGARRGRLAAVNLHNNRAGRRAVESSLATQCKCHGVSGSCSIKTCWKALPRLLDIGRRLKTKFAVATEVVQRRVGSGRRLLPASPAMPLFSEDDLIYVAKSPDYCLEDPRVGSQGTRGRVCNASSPGYDSCGDMCCGRGHRSVSVERVERCQCKYYWCCYVKCKTCRRWVEVHECN
ncbi:protein Wnt-11b-2-like [Bacillus rossius redtenbacheri]|uniref:protein Wnt-11b-2-like n=1 Tax=Bacillus rossius redtenbacheri TaxID=93214 RepID=UPI002FDEF00E